MEFAQSYEIKEKLNSLSERLKYLARNTQAYNAYAGQDIKSSNLKFNFSLLLAKIILELHFTDRSMDVFEKIIEEYNTSHTKKIIFSDFQKLNWIRIISGEAILPSLIRDYILDVSNKEKEGKAVALPEDKNDLIRCLQIYFARCFQDSKLTISKDTVEEILTSFCFKEITIDFLIQVEILGYDSTAGIYYWKGGEYSRHLSNEIAATLWLLVGSENATDVQFKRYLKLVQGTSIWVDDLGAFLNYNNIARLCKLAVGFLRSEEDLLKSDTEFAKIWLDSPSYLHISIETAIPDVKLNYNNAYDFIDSVDCHRRRLHDVFDYQRTRSFCHLLLRIIVPSEQWLPAPYKSVLNIIKDTSRPSVLWTLYNDIKREFPYVIPYLLTDLELAPLAFRLIDKIEIDNLLLSGQSNSDRKVEESLEVKNQLWSEMFDLVLQQITSSQSHEKVNGGLITKILTDISEKVFSINSTNKDSVINHHAIRRQYDSVLKKLANERYMAGTTYPRPPISPRVIHVLLPEIASYIKETVGNRIHDQNNQLNLNSSFLDLGIEMLRLASLRVTEFEMSAIEKNRLTDSSNDITTVLYQEAVKFYSVNEIDVQPYDGIESKKVKRGTIYFGFEIIDWGYLYLHFEKGNLLDNLYQAFIGSLNFKNDGNKYDEENKEQNEKIYLFLKSLMIAFISVNQKKDLHEIDGLPARSTLAKLEKWIKVLSLKHSIDAIAEARIDVFNERSRAFGNDMYYQQLITLLYNSINFFESRARNEFVHDFFALTNDTGRMLTAINILDSKELKDIISTRVRSVEIEDFIASRSTITELQNALVEAANSEDHWELANPLIKRILEHLKRVKHNDDHTNNFLFEINLLLAFKEKDFDKLIKIAIPKSNSYYPTEHERTQNIKRFFIALYQIYTDKQYDKAIVILTSLLSEEPKNIRYAYHLYRAETLNAIGTKSDFTLLNQANKDWENFVENLDGQEKKGLPSFAEPIFSNLIHFLAASKDVQRFDQTVNKLSKRYLHDEELIPTIYHFYIERDLQELAFDYLSKSEMYLKENHKAIPIEIQNLVSNSETPQLLHRLKLGLEKTMTLKPRNISSIIPQVINDKRELGEFILHELVLASRVLLDKIHAIKQISHEDRFNDLLLAVLRLRFAIWGWTIQDQARLGSSPKGISAGEVDILIQSAGQNIAFIEALILDGGNYSKTKEHILKCFSYVAYLTRYYIIIYYRGPSANFEKAWTAYKANVLKILFPPLLAINKKYGFIDMLEKFDDIRHLKISKTSHGSEVEIFHMMINVSV